MEYFESSLSSSKPIHVYLSFRGDEETRQFIHGLSAALKAEGFRIFGDDKKLEMADSNLPDHLLQAIRQSWIFIVVFSKSYTSSIWCIEELLEVAYNTIWRVWPEKGVLERSYPYAGPAISATELEERFEAYTDEVKSWRLDMKQEIHSSEPRQDVGGRVIPVFYDVYPSFAEEYEERYPDGEDEDKILVWRQWQAIKQVAKLPGCDVRNSSRSDATQKIVRKVKEKVDQMFYGYFPFVGMQTRVEKVEKLLDLGLEDVVRVIGICGMGGLGKSSIASILYLKIFHHFDAFCFLPHLSGRLKLGDVSLQELLRRNIETKNSQIRNILSKEFLSCKRLRHHKFLIVLDGVDLVKDLRELNLDDKSNCFGGGSRIIITTRDKRILQTPEVDAIYGPELLTKEEAFELFYREAFQREYPINDFEERMDRVLEYANGLPLAIKMLGSALFGASVVEWRSFLNREEIILPNQIIMALRDGFDELGKNTQQMFLDMACFFVGKDIDYVKEILHDCGFPVEEGINLLFEKSLITISNQKIQMHDMVRAMGREIVRRESLYYPKDRSRLWLFNDIKSVMEQDEELMESVMEYDEELMESVMEQDKELMESVMEYDEELMAFNKVEAIVLDLDKPEEATLRINNLSSMSNLRLLIFRNVNCSGNLNNLPSKLQYVWWHQYPFTCLPSSFQSDTLVQLIMPDSNIKEIWKGEMTVPMLRNLNLCGSKHLIKTPNFRGVLNLERLDLEGCNELLQLDPSIAKLSNLKFVNLRNCINLLSIPNNLFSLSSLETLNLAGCSKFAYCLKFSPLRSLIEVRVLSIWYGPIIGKILYFLLCFTRAEELS